MEKQILVVKENRAYLDLLNQIGKQSALALKRYHKKVTWLQFAKLGRYGYHFLNNKQSQWEVLQEIARKVKLENKDYTEGQVVATISLLVNTTVKNEIRTNKLRVKSKQAIQYKKYLTKLLIEEIIEGKFIPRHSWLRIVDLDKDNSCWKAVDLTDGKKHTVKVTTSDKFVTYTINDRFCTSQLVNL